MVLLHQIVQVLAGADLHPPRKFAVFLHLSHCPVRGRIGVQRDLRGHASVLHRAAQKRFGGVYVPLPAEKEIDRLAGFVDGAVQVYPLPVNLYTGFVHPPRSAHGPSVAPPALFEFWKVALHPPQDRGMGHGDPSIRHHDHQIPQAQFEARVPAHAPNNDLSVEVPSSEQIFDRDEPLHLFIIARLPRICTRASLGTLRLFEVDAISVQQWVYRMEDKGLARTTRKSSLAVLRSLFDAAEEWGYFVGRNPAKKIKLGGGGEVWDKRALEPAEALLLLQALDGEEPLRTMVEVCLFVDLRSSEVRGLTWGAIDGTRSMVEVKQGRSQHGELAEPKSARGRRKLDLGPLVKRFVRPDGANPCDLIWPDASYFALQKKLRRVGKQVGIDFPGFGFHTLRRTHATWRDDLRLSSRPDEALVRDMGHADSRTTALYITGTKTGVVERLQNHVYFSGDSRDGRSVN